MIQAIGTDIVEVDRIAKAMADSPGFVQRILTDAEISQVGRDNPQRIAGRWAAKEAIRKVIGPVPSFHSIEIFNTESGAPYSAAPIPPGTRLHITISHEKSVACAVAILERIP